MINIGVSEADEPQIWMNIDISEADEPQIRITNVSAMLMSLKKLGIILASARLMSLYK